MDGFGICSFVAPDVVDDSFCLLSLITVDEVEVIFEDGDDGIVRFVGLEEVYDEDW